MPGTSSPRPGRVRNPRPSRSALGQVVSIVEGLAEIHSTGRTGSSSTTSENSSAERVQASTTGHTAIQANNPRHEDADGHRPGADPQPLEVPDHPPMLSPALRAWLVRYRQRLGATVINTAGLTGVAPMFQVLDLDGRVITLGGEA